MPIRLPLDWLDVLNDLAEREGTDRTSLIRSFISECLSRRRIEHSVDDFGVFEKKWRMTKQERKRAKWREYVRRYRAKKKRLALAEAELADSIQWTFHPTGQVTTSDLDPLATYVGTIDDQGHFLPESTRYGKDRVLSELRKLAEQGPLPGDRFALFLKLNPA